MARFTAEQLQKLEDAIAQGALRVKYADKEVQYQSVSDMLRIRELMRRDLGISAPASGRIYPTVSKGLG